MYRLSLLLLLLFAGHTANAVTNDGGIPWRTMESDEPSTHNRPMLLYFGAKWCPPCRVLETKIFNQPDVRTAMGLFDAVYVDGDSTNAKELLERFNVFGYPTVLAIAPDGQEVGRFAGSPKKDDFIEFLTDSSGTKVPMAMLKRLAQGKSLSTAEWTALSAVPVTDAGSLRDDEDYGVAELKLLRDRLAQAVTVMERVHPPLSSLVSNRIRTKSLLLDALSNHPGGIAEHAAALDQVLGNPESLVDLTYELAKYSKEILDYLNPEDSPGKRARTRKFIEMMEAESSRFSANAPLQIEMMQLQLPLLEIGSDNPDAERRKFTERVELLLKQATSPAERVALVSDAAYLLSSMGREFRAEAVLRETLKASPDAVFLNEVLAYYAYQRGDMDRGVQHAEARFRGSLDSPRAVRWGVDWVSWLIERDPAASADIEKAANEITDLAMKSGEVFHGFNAKTMTDFGALLGRWAMGQGDAATQSRLLVRLGQLCDSVQDDSVQAKACADAIEAFNNPPAEEQPGASEST